MLTLVMTEVAILDSVGMWGLRPLFSEFNNSMGLKMLCLPI